MKLIPNWPNFEVYLGRKSSRWLRLQRKNVCRLASLSLECEITFGFCVADIGYFPHRRRYLEIGQLNTKWIPNYKPSNKSRQHYENITRVVVIFFQNQKSLYGNNSIKCFRKTKSNYMHYAYAILLNAYHTSSQNLRKKHRASWNKRCGHGVNSLPLDIVAPVAVDVVRF